MCGIFGVVGDKINQGHARHALQTLMHRGPDQWNECTGNEVYLGHTRLSILDLSENGIQPMISKEHHVVVAVNGEIYNYRKLREQLKNYEFQSDSDSEVVLHGFTEWGISGLLERMEGMFALVIIDNAKNKIYLSRDRVGIKPLYYSLLNGELVFASELKSIVEYYGADNLELDKTALYDFYTYQYIPTPKTLYQNIFKLPPATYLEFDINDKTCTESSYWSLQITEDKSIDIELAKKQIRSLTESSVQEQMMSDVPVGFFLSGGLDSSVVSALARSHSSQLKTFSIGFENDPGSELPFAEEVAHYIQSVHHAKTLSRDSAKELIKDLKNWYDEPFGDISCIPTYLVSEYAKKSGITVVLTGDGGDEVFGGYTRYKVFRTLKKPIINTGRTVLRKILGSRVKRIQTKNKWVERLTWLVLDDLELYTKLMGGLLKHEKSDFKVKLDIPTDYDDYWYFRKFYRPELPVYTRLQSLDFHTYLPDDILTKVDRVSMAVSLECRVPLLSTPLIEYIFSIPENVRLYNNQLKGAMKLAFSDAIPETVIKRKKKGFNIPVSTWKNTLTEGYNNRFEMIIDSIFHIR